ncbi:MAG: hypothetical protein E2O68_00005, partial [Deltaproteobacteria bacterium]
MNLRPIFLILMLGCSAGTSVDQSGGLPPFLIGTWSPISPAPIDPRAAAVSHWTGSEMLVWGGEGENGSLGDGALYNPSNNTWRIMEPSGAPSDRTDLFNFRETWTGGANPELLIWSGRSASDYYYGGSTTFTNLFDGALYDYSSDTWSSIRSTTGDSDPDFLSYAGRAYLTGFYTGSEFIIWAGN